MRVPVSAVIMSMDMICMTMMPVILAGMVRAICVVMIPVGMMRVIRMAMIGVIMIVSMIVHALVFRVHRMECPLMLKRPASEQYRKVLVRSAQSLCGAALPDYLPRLQPQITQ